MFESIDMSTVNELLKEVETKPKDNIVLFMKKYKIKRLKFGVKEFEIELR